MSGSRKDVKRIWDSILYHPFVFVFAGMLVVVMQKSVLYFGKIVKVSIILNKTGVFRAFIWWCLWQTAMN